jgi:hypothetical protein
MHPITQSEEGEIGEYIANMGEMRNAYKILVEKPEGMTPLRRHRRR